MHTHTTHAHSLSHTHTQLLGCTFVDCFRYVSIAIEFISFSLSLSHCFSFRFDSFRFVTFCLASLWFRIVLFGVFFYTRFFIRHLIRLISCALSNALALSLALPLPLSIVSITQGARDGGMQNTIGQDNSSRLYASIVQARLLLVILVSGAQGLNK